MTGTWPFIAEKIATRLALIAPHIHRKQQPLPKFRFLPLPKADVNAPIFGDAADWETIPHNSYWGRADQNFVMTCTFQVPEGWDPERVALQFPLGVMGDIFNHPEALVYLDDQPIGSADRYHHTIPLPASASDGAPHILTLHGWTGLAGWPPDPDSAAKLFMGRPAIVERDPTLLAFHQLAETTLDTARALDRDDPVAGKLLKALDHAFITLDTRDPIGDALYDTATDALMGLEGDIAEAGTPLDVTLHGIGHAHMDIAYLWPISQIRLKNARTYTNVLRLMDEDPDYRFSHSQPQLYAMLAEDYPAIFEKVKTRVTEGRWEVMGGMWVEPDLNIPGPEALIRQLTLGRSYFRETFGEVDAPVLWLPDTFGFPAQIPQLMKLAGLRWFATNKLNWNQANPVPSSTHLWEGLDGTQVLAHVLTTPRDVQYLPFPTNYKSDLSAREVLGTWARSTAPDTIRDLPICYGYGDGGGGPTETLLAKARIFADMPGMPRIKHSSVRETFEALEASEAELPVWSGEHYLECHRGVLTSQGWIKRANRKAEAALHEAEALAAMAGQTPELGTAWRLLCLNQFHDILTGTSIAQVFEDARADFARIMDIAETASLQAANALALREPAIANVSPMSGPRVALVGEDIKVDGQLVEGGTLVHFDTLPSYSITPITAATRPAASVTCETTEGEVTLENPHLRVEISATGQVTRVFDKRSNRDVLMPGEIGNRLIAFEDRPICWDAWDIDPFYEDRPEIVQGDTKVRTVESGPLRAAVEVTTKWRSSTICQRIELCAHSTRLDFVSEVDWHERHTLMKAAFPTSIQATSADFDIQWGRITRATTRDTSFDAARFEVPAQKWGSVSDDDLAVAVLNDCKYGYDVLGGRIRITLIKSSTSPDPGADQGHHEFTYSLFSFDPDRPELLNSEAYALNIPLRLIDASTQPTGRSVGLIESQNSDIIVQTLKPADDGNGMILRVFETLGRRATTQLSVAKNIERVERCDIFERPGDVLESNKNSVALMLGPFEIMTLRMVLSQEPAR
ncbi:alpha-mannosidase [Litoreibacter ponti]|uniref:Alpha-mannosidase n=1 Tax=Litoreibacter ponti TaxID=1510457 RepID=A0A2T6BFS4_9RHOB|nr:glycoside hydrolase family 38 C-terminal domain-containing protein [Litoreibacter ponti]PTX54899.1 alpha-mannosidase [Litoreibacter ponti]